MSHLSKDGNADTSDILGQGGSGGNNPYRDPNGGAYGPDTCQQGYVWRDSFDGDTVCVTPPGCRAETLTPERMEQLSAIGMRWS
ncbi:hypothetical protein [Streptomyces sp. NPDC001389]|uniref:hypothetical protein n=1 Tax=Streptomyces sp. NPDC001389 TaxID=3364569 RepID=UPI00367A0659